MILVENYKDNIYEAWYDSSNVLYSKCYDSIDKVSDVVTLNLVFKGGRTYKYRNVSKSDYVAFKASESNGKGFTDFIKKYECVRMEDTNLDTLEQRKQTLLAEKTQIGESKVKEINCHLKMNDKTGMFSLYVNDERVISGVEGQLSIINVLNALNIRYSYDIDNDMVVETDEHLNKIVL